MKKYLKNIIALSVIWTLALMFFSILRQFGQELVNGPAHRSIVEHIFVYSLTGFVVGVTFETFDRFLNKRMKAIKSFGMVIVLRSFLILIMLTFLIVVGVLLYMIPDKEDFNFNIVWNFIFSKEGVLTLFYLFIISLLIQFVKQMDKKFGPGNLLRMLKGEFYSPKEVERIVMFIDLKSSTTIAEKIGHLKYSLLIQECFDELNIANRFNAEIYQYVGDEVVLVWEPTKGLKNANCLKFYYAFSQLLSNKSGHFKSKYGVVPKFKCGCHIGKVIMTEIGQIKREIAYHGDVMNTASRIQGQCNVNNKEFLISETLYRMLSDHTNFRFDFVEKVNLKGKTNEVKIYSVSNSTNP